MVPAIYLAAQALFHARVEGAWGRMRLAGVLACAAVGVVGMALPAIMVAALLLIVLIAVIVGEHVERASTSVPAAA